MNELFDAIKASGLRISILYEGEDGVWRCTLARDYPQAEAGTLKEVLEKAMANAQASS